MRVNVLHLYVHVKQESGSQDKFPAVRHGILPITIMFVGCAVIFLLK